MRRSGPIGPAASPVLTRTSAEMTVRGADRAPEPCSRTIQISPDRVRLDRFSRSSRRDQLSFFLPPPFFWNSSLLAIFLSCVTLTLNPFLPASWVFLRPFSSFSRSTFWVPPLSWSARFHR